MSVQEPIIVHGAIEPVDILAFGPHPDDIEIGAAGSLLKWIGQGKKVGLVDLNRGELGTKGTAEERLEESKEAAIRLGATFRVNLGLPDGSVVDDAPSREQVVKVIRESRPKFVLSNLEEAHHPDHKAGAQLVKSSYFLSRLPKYLVEVPAHSPIGLFYYLIHSLVTPTFLVDVTETFERKFEVMGAYHTQFVEPKTPDGYQYTGIQDYLRNVRSLGEAWGVQAGCPAAEAFRADKPPIVESLEDLIAKPD
ncbi:MAG: bacillithiol biosynthesis deacetylase BshB1 [Candidatus Omnitrophica bacterium]|nr:bacillithiol biosynthesis deacetylase BshB1 [Candidatus Omnitrophota bacterium]